jgi:hypothetical protein
MHKIQVEGPVLDRVGQYAGNCAARIPRVMNNPGAIGAHARYW